VMPNFLLSWPGDHVEVSLAWQELQACGLVVMAAKPPPDTHFVGGGQGQVYVTARGHEWLASASSSPAPEDPDGFITALARDAKLDPFVRTTVSEAVWAYAQKRPVSALVCLAAAAEFMIRAVDDASPTAVKTFNISGVFESLDKRLGAVFAKKTKPPHVATFLSTFSISLRDARNDVAHKGTITDLPQVRRFLLQYLDWHEAAAKLRDNPAC